MLLADDSPLLLSSKHTMLAVVEPLGLVVGFAVVEPLGLVGTALVLIMVLGGGWKFAEATSHRDEKRPAQCADNKLSCLFT